MNGFKSWKTANILLYTYMEVWYKTLPRKYFEYVLKYSQIYEEMLSQGRKIKAVAEVFLNLLNLSDENFNRYLAQNPGDGSTCTMFRSASHTLCSRITGPALSNFVFCFDCFQKHFISLHLYKVFVRKTEANLCIKSRIYFQSKDWEACPNLGGLGTRGSGKLSRCWTGWFSVAPVGMKRTGLLAGASRQR